MCKPAVRAKDHAVTEVIEDGGADSIACTSVDDASRGMMLARAPRYGASWSAKSRNKGTRHRRRTAVMRILTKVIDKYGGFQ
jgi:hypothetical protein